MASFDIFINKLLRLEGGYVNHKNDRGGCTCKGVTLPVFRGVYGAGLTCDDLRDITDDQAGTIYKKNYWDVCKADKIRNSCIAYLLVDYAVNSGVRTAIKAVQRLLDVEVDGVVGPVTIGAINAYSEPKELFDRLMEVRKNHYLKIVENNPSQKVFLKGWMNRLNEWEWKD